MFIQIVYVAGMPVTMTDSLTEARDIVNWARIRGVTAIHEIRWLQEPCTRTVMRDTIVVYPKGDLSMPMISIARGRWTYPRGSGWEAQTK